MLKSRGSVRVGREATDLPLENFSYPVGEKPTICRKGITDDNTLYIFQAINTCY